MATIDAYGDLVTEDTSDTVSTYNPRQYGVFAQHPLMTPKYAINNGSRDAEFKETLARMYISLESTSPETIEAYKNSLPNDAQLRALADVLLGSGQTPPTGFIDFFLEQVNETFQERSQVDEVLSDNYVAWYFGMSPPMFQFSGNLLNSLQDDQVTGFALAYQHLLRGSKLARKGALLRIRYDNVIISCTVNQMSRVLNAANELICPFNFSVLVKEYILLQNSGGFNKIDAEDFVKLSTAFAEAGVLTDVGTVADDRVRTTVMMPVQPSRVSSAGGEEPTRVATPDTPPAQQLISDGQNLCSEPVTANVTENPVTTGADPPPPAYTPGGPPYTPGGVPYTPGP